MTTPEQPPKGWGGFSMYLALLTIILNIFSAGAGTSITHRAIEKRITLSNDKLTLTVDYDHKCVVTGMTVNGESVLSERSGLVSGIRTGQTAYSTQQLTSSPNVTIKKNQLVFDGMQFGEKGSPLSETWTFTVTDEAIDLKIDRTVAKTLKVEEAGFPSIRFKSIRTWDGAFLDFGGLAWFYLFNSPLCTYGVHSAATEFWNNTTGNGLRVAASAPGQHLVSKFSRTNTDELEYGLTVSRDAVEYRHDAGTNRRRFIRGGTDVWAPITLPAGTYSEQIRFSWLNYLEAYNRGSFTGIDGTQVSNLLNTIARIGVIDKKHFGGNSWHTPYGPICLHEQYIAQMGLGINDPNYTKGYKECLDYYRDNAIDAEGRVLSRWAYTDEDAMPGTPTSKGFYEAQWGYLMDSNPDFVTNVSELYQQCGDLDWVRNQKVACEKALEYMLKRDTNANHLVEVKTDSESEKRGSDWIDIVWASFENAFVNAKLYHALKLWADIESQLGDAAKSERYTTFAAELKKSFNNPTEEGGFWDRRNKWYVYWLDKDRSVHGNNLVIPVNFMAISYGLCDEDARKQAILDQVENQMRQENLFFWPLSMYPYAVGDVSDGQYPFPVYENGDLFLSWGSVGIDAYAGYKPDLALKYVENILAQYKKDGLAFQRYLRYGQQGAGDDILSGNALSIIGLYKSIYGINPRYNRLYLAPHLPAKLNGTMLLYQHRGEKLSIELNANRYSIGNGQFRLTASSDFGFDGQNDLLSFFQGENDEPALRFASRKGEKMSVEILKCSDKERIWKQSGNHSKVECIASRLIPGTNYVLSYGEKNIQVKTDSRGDVHLKLPSCPTNSEIRLTVSGS